jgi:hypothetical protein
VGVLLFPMPVPINNPLSAADLAILDGPVRFKWCHSLRYDRNLQTKYTLLFLLPRQRQAKYVEYDRNWI